MDIKTFETRDTELAAYLMLEGLKFFECKIDPQDKTKGIFVFFDEKSIGRDLERNFVSSEMKKFCDRRKYLLKEVFRTLKGLK